MNDNNRNPMKPYKTNGGDFSAMWGIIGVLALLFVMFVVFYNDPIWWVITIIAAIIAVPIGIVAGEKKEEEDK